MSEASERSELERRLEAEAKLAIVEIELRMARAEAEQRIAILEASLEAERGSQADVELARGDTFDAIVSSYKQQVELLRAELDLWRRDDRDALVPVLEARIAVLDRSAEQVGDGPHREGMKAALAQSARERAELVAAIERLNAGS